MRHCNLAGSFELIGDRWTLLILRSALYGVRRFDDFQADIDIPRSVLSNRLAGWSRPGSWSGASTARKASARVSNIRSPKWAVRSACLSSR
jgi:hypothetical protein